MGQIPLANIIIAAVLSFGGLFFLFAAKKDHSKSSGKSLSIDNYLTDVTEQAKTGKLEAFFGREVEIARTVHIILRRTKNNPLLIGNPGVGKTAIAHGLAELIVKKQAPKALWEKRVLALDLAGLLAGTEYRGELEKRLRQVIVALESKSREIILFIDEVHMLEQANGSEGGLNVSDILKPALARGDLQVIGATTWQEYEKFIKPDVALNRRFQPVVIGEPTPSDAVAMLSSLRPVYEEFHGVKISDAALKAAVTLSKKIKNRYLPDKAIDLMDEASAAVAIESSSANYLKSLGLVHAAAHHRRARKTKTKSVTPRDIQSVVSQWANV